MLGCVPGGRLCWAVSVEVGWSAGYLTQTQVHAFSMSWTLLCCPGTPAYMAPELYLSYISKMEGSQTHR